jgi:AbrB family looped-hinge helix DNA binding protein
MNIIPKFYGKIPLGTKGQIVIPAEARKAMNIKPGDKVIIISGPPHHERAISVIPEDDFNKFLKFYEEHLGHFKEGILKNNL